MLCTNGANVAYLGRMTRGAAAFLSSSESEWDHSCSCADLQSATQLQGRSMSTLQFQSGEVDWMCIWWESYNTCQRHSLPLLLLNPMAQKGWRRFSVCWNHKSSYRLCTKDTVPGEMIRWKNLFQNAANLTMIRINSRKLNLSLHRNKVRIGV